MGAAGAGAGAAAAARVGMRPTPRPSIFFLFFFFVLLFGMRALYIIRVKQPVSAVVQAENKSLNFVAVDSGRAGKLAESVSCQPKSMLACGEMGWGEGGGARCFYVYFKCRCARYMGEALCITRC